MLIGSGSGGTGSGKNWKARHWNVMDGKPIREFTGHDSGAIRIAVSDDGKQMSTQEVGKMVRTWDLETGKIQREMEWPVHGQFAVFGYSRASELVGVAPNRTTNEVPALDLLTGKTLTTWKPEGRSYLLGLSPDTRLVAALEDTRERKGGGYDQWIVRDRTKNGDIVSRLPVEAPNYLNPVAFSFDNQMVAVAVGGYDGKTIQLHEVRTGNLIRTFKGHTGMVSALAFSPDGKKLASGAWDSTVLIWDLASKP